MKFEIVDESEEICSEEVEKQRQRDLYLHQVKRALSLESAKLGQRIRRRLSVNEDNARLKRIRSFSQGDIVCVTRQQTRDTRKRKQRLAKEASWSMPSSPLHHYYTGCGR